MSLSSWRDIRTGFLQGASKYPDLSAHWDSRQGLWTLKDGEIETSADDEAGRLYKDTARDAIALLGKAASIAPSFYVWLNLLKDGKRGFQHSYAPRGWAATRALLEAGPHSGPVSMSNIPLSKNGTIKHVFQESADFCADLTSGRVAEFQAQRNLSKGEGTMNLQELPRRFQDAFQTEKANAELEYATRAERLPNHPQFADEALHGLLLIQNVFFAFCAQARQACREGDWTMAQASHAVDAAWPSICDFYFVRERDVHSEDSLSGFRVALWKTITDEPRWKQHLRDLAALTVGARNATATGLDRNNPSAADTADPDTKAEDETKRDTNVGSPEHGPPLITPQKRLTSTISSVVAARRLHDYFESNPLMDLTDFATRAQTSDRTLRSFRKTGRVRRDIFENIARAMGTTPEELLKPK